MMLFLLLIFLFLRLVFRFRADFPPIGICVERGHRFGYVSGMGTEILLVDDALAVNQEGHHARVSVDSRVSQETKATSHGSVNDVVLGATGRFGALAGECAEEVSMECGLFVLVSFAVGKSDERTDGTFWLALGGLPVQSVLFAGIADELLGVLVDRRTIVQSGEVIDLGVSQNAANPDGGVFVAPYPAVQNLFQPGLGVELPLPAGVFLKRDRKGPVLCAEKQRLIAIDFLPPAIHLLVAPNEVVRVLLVHYRVTGRNDTCGRGA